MSSSQKSSKNACLLAGHILFLMLCGSARASLYSFGFNGSNGAIPDGDPNGLQNSQTINVGVPNTQIAGLTVTLNVSGGYNGDLYAYLTHGSGFAVLLNRVGTTASDPFGYANTGFQVTLSDTAANGDIHLYQTAPNWQNNLNANGALTAAWQPDGRNVNPLSVVDTDPRTALLSSFNGLDPNGGWTLFFADLSSGEQSTLESWSLSINAVPEPTTYALIAFGGLVALRIMIRRFSRLRS